eukprot:43145-Hanusia_phi.AAC.1
MRRTRKIPTKGAMLYDMSLHPLVCSNKRRIYLDSLERRDSQRVGFSDTSREKESACCRISRATARAKETKHLI